MGKKIAIGCGVTLLLFIILTVSAVRIYLKNNQKTPRVETADIGNVTERVIEDGTVQPFSKVDVKSRVSGRILQLFVHEGQQVKIGQILTTIDPEELTSQVKALQDQLAGAEARSASSKKNVVFQQLQTATSIAQYKQNLASAAAHVRQAEIQAKIQPYLTQQAIEAASANLDAVKANLKSQQDALTLLVGTTDPNAVVSAQSAYDQAKAQASNTQLLFQRQQKMLEKGFVPQQSVDTAQTNYEVAEASLREAKEKLDRIRQANKIQEDNARSLVASANAQVMQASAALLQAQADTLPRTREDDLAAARAAYAQAAAQLASAKSGLVQNQVQQDNSRAAASDARQINNTLAAQAVLLGDTTLYSPMTGVVTKRYVEVGDLITSIGSFSSGTAVYQIADLNTMLVKIEVNEVDINNVKKGMLTLVTTDSSPGVTFIGHVSKVAPAASSYTSSTASSSAAVPNGTVIRFPVEIRIDHADPRLRPGMSAHCTIIIAEHKKVVRIPADCLYGGGTNPTVHIQKEEMRKGEMVKTTVIQPVQVGLRSEEFVEIVSGLHGGEKLIPAPYTGPKRQGLDMRNNRD